jgi:hypothetical protein
MQEFDRNAVFVEQHGEDVNGGAAAVGVFVVKTFHEDVQEFAFVLVDGGRVGVLTLRQNEFDDVGQDDGDGLSQDVALGVEQLDEGGQVAVEEFRHFFT